MNKQRNTLASEMSEAESIKGAKRGDEECFERLYSLHKRRVYSVCLRMMRSVEAAEDFTQEAFLQLYRKITSFRGDSAFSTWLHRITVNIVLMHMRKRKLPEISLDDTMDSGDDGISIRREISAQDQVLAGAIDRVILQRAMADLPDGYRIMFALHDIEGYEHSEIAEIMGCSIGTSKSQLHKARMRLRNQLRMAPSEERRQWTTTVRPQAFVAIARRPRAAAATA